MELYGVAGFPRDRFAGRVLQYLRKVPGTLSKTLKSYSVISISTSTP